MGVGVGVGVGVCVQNCTQVEQDSSLLYMYKISSTFALYDGMGDRFDMV